MTQFGIFVQLDALYIEGLVHVTDLGADYFQYDDARHELRGERTGKRYQLTDRVTVQVSRVDLDARKIDLCLVQPGGAKNGKPGSKPPGKQGSTMATKAKPKAIAGASRYEEIAPPKHKVRRGTAEGKPSRSAKATAASSSRETRAKGNAGSTKTAAKTSLKKR